MPTINESAARSIEKLMETILPEIWNPTYTVQDILNLILGFLDCPYIILDEYKQIAMENAIQYAHRD